MRIPTHFLSSLSATLVVALSAVASGCATELHLEGEPPADPPVGVPAVPIPAPIVEPRFPHVSPAIELDSTVAPHADHDIGSYPAVAFDGDRYLAAWLEAEFVHDEWTTVVRAARVSAEGESLDAGGIVLGTADHRVRSLGAPPIVAAAPGQFMVVWGGGQGAEGVRYMRIRSDDGVLLDAPGVTLPVGAAETDPPTVTFFEGDFVIGFSSEGEAALAFFDAAEGRLRDRYSRGSRTPIVHRLGAGAVEGLARSGEHLVALVTEDVPEAGGRADGPCGRARLVVLAPDPEYRLFTLGSQALWPDAELDSVCAPFAIAGNGRRALVATTDATALRSWSVGSTVGDITALAAAELSRLRNVAPAIAATPDGFVVAAGEALPDEVRWSAWWTDGVDAATPLEPLVDTTQLALAAGAEEILVLRHLRGNAGGPGPGLLHADFIGASPPHELRFGPRLFSAAIQDDAAVAQNGDVALTVWVDRLSRATDLDPPERLRMRLVDLDDGTPSSDRPSELFACEEHQCSILDPAVASDGDGFLVVWTYSNGYLFHRRFFGLRLDGQGVPIDAAPFALGVSGFHHADPVVVADGDGYLVAFRSFRPVQDYCNCYEQEHAIAIQRVPAVGAAEPAMEVTDRGSRPYVRPTLASDGAGFLLAWEERLVDETADDTCRMPCQGPASIVRAAELSAEGGVLPWGGVEVGESDRASHPVASYGQGHYVLAWRDASDPLQHADVRMKALSPGGLRPAGPSTAIVETPFADERHRIAADGDGFLITWVTDETLWATRFDLDGTIDMAHVLEVHVGESGSFWRSSGGLVRSAPGEFLSVFTHIDGRLGRHRAKARFIVYDGPENLR